MKFAFMTHISFYILLYFFLFVKRILPIPHSHKRIFLPKNNFSVIDRQIRGVGCGCQTNLTNICRGRRPRRPLNMEFFSLCVDYSSTIRQDEWSPFPDKGRLMIDEISRIPLAVNYEARQIIYFSS